ncbi:MAG: 30S ribosomal protein S1 [Candidatus Moranbacteria bacterium]|nr:30S ribosomal protein S1 [Candidatus Moranbacteria bacterium]
MSKASDSTVLENLIEEDSVEIPSVGDAVTGTVIHVASNQALVDLGPLGTGVVLGKEMKSGLSGGAKLHVGEEVIGTLVSFENEDGDIEISIREASYEKAWEDLFDKLEGKSVIETKVQDANKGGLMVELNGIMGFLPVSQLANEHYPRVEDGDKNKILDMLRSLIGETISIRILDIDRENEKLIVSEKAAQSERDRELIGRLRPGEMIEGEVSGVVDFGAFVKFDAPIDPNGKKAGQKLEGLVHISELAWQLIDNPREIVKTGDHVKAKIIGIEDTRISLSMKALQKDPWTAVLERYQVGQIVSGKVDKINHFGAFVYLDDDIHGLAHVSEFQDVYPRQKMEDIFRTGETYDWKILSIEQQAHRMGLLPVKDAGKKKKTAEGKGEEKKSE